MFNLHTLIKRLQPSLQLGISSTIDSNPLWASHLRLGGRPPSVDLSTQTSLQQNDHGRPMGFKHLLGSRSIQPLASFRLLQRKYPPLSVCKAPRSTESAHRVRPPSRPDTRRGAELLTAKFLLDGEFLVRLVLLNGGVHENTLVGSKVWGMDGAGRKDIGGPWRTWRPCSFTIFHDPIEHFVVETFLLLHRHRVGSEAWHIGPSLAFTTAPVTTFTTANTAKVTKKRKRVLGIHHGAALVLWDSCGGTLKKDNE